MKYLCRIEKDHITIFKMKRKSRQMVSIASRLYRTDDDIALKDQKSEDAMYFYPIDSTQPLLLEPRLVDPDYTRALIGSAKYSGNQKKIWGFIDGGQLKKMMVPLIVVACIVYGFIMGGGL